jgi:hypothetical protein
MGGLVNCFANITTMLKGWPTTLAGCALAVLVTAAPAQDATSTRAAPRPLPAATGVVILEVRGAIGRTNGPGTARLDLAALQALPQQQITTRMPWYDSVQNFQEVQMTALNDYTVTIPWSDISRYQPLLAHQINGKPLSVREKGPLFLVYPFDRHPEIKNDIYYGRSIWQIATLTVR